MTSRGFVAAFTLIAGFASGGLAQGLPGGASTLNETHGDWTVACAVPDEEVRCAVSQIQLSGESGQRVLTVELQAIEGGAAAIGVLVLPFGLRFDDGVRLAIDDAAPLPISRFSTCLPAGCLVPLAFDMDTVTALSSATVLGVTAAASDGGHEIAFSISLSGFTSALVRAAELSAS